ncbi:finger domain protein [Teratosphaeria destructans]|uniref:Finger domain protein n=1 Tax=Teratosphaeria destructans TaxID=418781 RepID=A0A9W7VZQ3_9PEZI|nr:finger domain protein [Teratosphaeria destructans]
MEEELSAACMPAGADHVSPHFSDTPNSDTSVALRVPESSSPGSLEEVHQEDAAKYELRPQTRHSAVGFTSTWIDQDDTGDYDPRNERKLNLRRTRVRHLPTQSVLNPTESADVNVLTDSSARQPRSSLHVKLEVRDAECKAKLRHILESKPTQADIQYDPFVKTWQPRKEGTGRRKRCNKLTPDARSSDCAHAPDDLTGHPVARGCWGCLELGLEFAETCSLIHDEYEYPCRNCKAEDEYCTPILPPKYKQQCEGCKQRRKQCSYTYTTDHTGPCEECAAEGYQCAAGPLVEEIKPRIRYERDPADLNIIAAALAQTERQWQPKPRPVKKVSKSASKISLQETVPGGDLCSTDEANHAKKREGSDNTLDKTHPPQHIEPSPSSNSQHQVDLTRKKFSSIDLTEPSTSDVSEHHVQSAPKERIFIHLTEPSASSKKRAARALPNPPTKRLKTSPRTSSNNTSNTLTIRTTFRHPIAFNHIPKPTHKPPCNFCDHTSFPYLALAPKTVRVTTLPNGAGYTEVSGGYASLGHAPTRMCTKCTLQRFSIATCASHQIRPLARKNRKLDVEAALDALFANRPRDADVWCSLCPALAAHECRVEGCVDVLGRPCVGCGLKLCATCRAELGRLYGGDLQVMLRGLGRGPSEVRPLGLRADAEFLSQEGLLMGFVMGGV